MKNGGSCIDKFLEAAYKGFEETAVGALGFESIEMVDKSSEAPKDSAGAYIAMLSHKISLQLGIVASKEVCKTLARTLFDMEPDDEEIPASDVADALGEIANITAGVIKTLLSDEDGSFQLGLPIFVEGSITPSDEQELAVANIKMGPYMAHLVVLTPETGD